MKVLLFSDEGVTLSNLLTFYTYYNPNHDRNYILHMILIKTNRLVGLKNMITLNNNCKLFQVVGK